MLVIYYWLITVCLCTVYIGVGRFRILGAGDKVKNIGGGGQGGAKFPAGT